MLTPTAAIVRSQVPDTFDWDVLGYGDDADLAKIVTQANAYVVAVTGRPLDETMPPEFDPLALEAVTLRTIQVAYQRKRSYIATATDDLIASFSAGGYSETRRDPTQRSKQRTINSWPTLDDLLWLLMTDDRYDYWLFRTTGIAAPAFEVAEIDWGVRDAVGPLGGYYVPDDLALG